MAKMMTTLSIVFLLVPPTMYGAPIQLKSTILEKVDGKAIGITGESIALIKQYQAEIMKILLGEKTPNGRIGKYLYNDQKYSMQELSKLEVEHNDPQFKTILRTIRDDFEHVSGPFRQTLQDPGVKTIMGYLIEESCIERKRLNSLLYIWSQAPNRNEYELFDLHIQSIRDFEIFLIDLNNFLNDLVYSCPRAYAQFKEHVEKFNQAQPLVIALNLPKEQQDLFLKHINSALLTTAKNEITKNKIKELYTAFKAKVA